MAHHQGQTRVVSTGFAQQPAPRLGVIRVEPERYIEPREQVPDLVATHVPLRTDDAEHLEPGFLRRGPGSQEFADRRVQTQIRNPRFDQVIVDVAEHHGGHDGIGCRIVALDEQDALGRRMQFVGSREEFNPGQLGHPLVRDEQGHLVLPRRKLRQCVQPGSRRSLAKDAAVAPKAPKQIFRQCIQHRCLVGNQEDDRLSHLLHLRGAIPFR